MVAIKSTFGLRYPSLSQGLTPLHVKLRIVVAFILPRPDLCMHAPMLFIYARRSFTSPPPHSSSSSLLLLLLQPFALHVNIVRSNNTKQLRIDTPQNKFCMSFYCVFFFFLNHFPESVMRFSFIYSCNEIERDEGKKK